MKTVTIQIGNSDDKLTQQEWHLFVSDIECEISLFSENIHFSGASQGNAPWQNYAFVFEFNDNKVKDSGVTVLGDQYKLLKERLSIVGKKYKQDSVAWTEGTTEFI